MAPDRRTSRAEGSAVQSHARRLVLLGIVLAAVAMLALLAVLVLSYTPAFTISKVEADPTDHLSEDAIVRLAAVPEGATLLNLDESSVTGNLRRNPWVDSATYVREFPDRLRIQVHEAKVGAIVIMGTGNVAWLMGTDGKWIEPYPIEVPEGDSINDIALGKAHGMGVLLITDAPASVSPVAATEATDEALRAVKSYQEGFSDELKGQIVSYSVPSADSISCTLSSGVQVSLGMATNGDAKQRVILSILGDNSNKLTYLNVRDPSNPTYRAVSSDHVQTGSGAVGEGS